MQEGMSGKALSGSRLLAAIVLAAVSLGAEVFPEPLCEHLPEVSPEVKTWVALVAPEFAQVRVREMPEETVLEVFRRAGASGWGSIDVLTPDAFREQCTFHFGREALRALNAAFDLDLVTPFRAKDKEGHEFEMAAILAGRGKLVVFYDREGIVYRNEEGDRDFRLSSRVEFDAPRPGVLENVHGLCARILLLGCVRVRSLVKEGGVVQVRVGAFTAGSPLKPIKPREGAPPPVGRPAAAMTKPSEVQPPGQKHEDEDDEDDPGDPGRSIAIVMEAPVGQSAEEEEQHDDQKDQRHDVLPRSERVAGQPVRGGKPPALGRF